MRDKRPVDELSIEELERILAIKKREARQAQLARMERAGRVVSAPPAHEAANGTARPEVPIPVMVEAPPVVAPVTNGTLHTPAVEAAEPKPLNASEAPRFEDGDDMFADAAPRRDPAREAASRKRWIDRALLGVEVAAVLALVYIGANLVGAISALERETRAAQQSAEANRQLTIPTLAPTPTLRLENFVLPGGHTYSAETGAQFNYAEVPQHLLPMVQTEWLMPQISRPPTTSETALSIAIPDIDVSATIVQGVDWEALKQGVGQLPNGINPGSDTGNLVLTAHNDIYGELFRRLEELEAGDRFQVQTQTRLYTYVVTEQRIVDPTDVYVLENREGATATLISCYPYQVNTHRIVVFADRVS